MLHLVDSAWKRAAEASLASPPVPELLFDEMQGRDKFGTHSGKPGACKPMETGHDGVYVRPVM